MIQEGKNKASYRRTVFILLIVVALLALGYVGYRYIPAWIKGSSWVEDLGYEGFEVKPLTFHFTGDRSCPQVSIAAGNAEHELIFDTGCSIGLLLTNVMEDKIPHTLVRQVESVNRDGSHRGWMKQVRVEQIGVFGKTFREIETSMSDWSMVSSAEYNGNIGLAYFKNRTVTLDYAGQRIAVSGSPIDYARLNQELYTVLPLHHSTSKGEEDLIFFQAEMEQKPVTVFLDTGKNFSFALDPDCGYTAAEKPSGFIDIPVRIGKMELVFKDVARINSMEQADGLPYPTMLELNSDQIWKCRLLVTIDLIEQKIIFRKL